MVPPDPHGTPVVRGPAGWAPSPWLLQYLISTNTQTENRASPMLQKEESQLDLHAGESELQLFEENLQVPGYIYCH
ncbi:hypothetical protein AV530_011962 [Patagioenas fasciata monilis]|uniref:Uncharacterized protein n=1 Tax=Patagioenas fasciata monilis TaxID=372326 RepID=A0A1V4JUG0_PATFA|nr:hypothetical protein AV530_011962 [Patagioenas fasciata monilis]